MYKNKNNLINWDLSSLKVHNKNYLKCKLKSHDSFSGESHGHL